MKKSKTGRERVYPDLGRAMSIDPQGELRYGPHPCMGLYSESKNKPIQIIIMYNMPDAKRFEQAIQHLTDNGITYDRISREMRVTIVALIDQIDGIRKIEDYQIVHLVKNYDFNPGFFYQKEVEEMFVSSEGASSLD